MRSQLGGFFVVTFECVPAEVNAGRQQELVVAECVAARQADLALVGVYTGCEVMNNLHSQGAKFVEAVTSLSKGAKAPEIEVGGRACIVSFGRFPQCDVNGRAATRDVFGCRGTATAAS